MYIVATYLALVLLATPLHATISIFLLYATFAFIVAWTTGIRLPTEQKTLEIKTFWIFIVVALFAAVRIIPFIRWGSSALGADMGAYYANFNACFASIATCMQEPTALFGYPLYALGMDTQTILIMLHYGATIALLYGIYRVANEKWGKNAALWSAAVCAVSVPQFLFYWSFFLKMEIAIVFSLFSLHAYTQGQKRAGIYGAFAGMIHPITLVPLVTAIVAAGIADNKKRFSIASAGMAIAATAAFRWNELQGYAHYLVTYMRGTYAPGEEKLLAGHFVEFSLYHNALMLFYVPFALLVITWCVRHGKMPAIGWYALVNLILISVNALFHNRFIVMFDISCIILSGYAISVFANRHKTPLHKAGLFLLILFISWNTLYESVRMEPLVNRAEFKELLSLQGIYNNMPIFINNATYQQFVAGYTKHMVIISSFNENPWQALKTPSLIYNARRSTPINPLNEAHFVRISDRIFKYTP